MRSNLIALQVVSLYFWTAYDETGWRFLSGGGLEAIFAWVHANRPFEMLLDNPFALMAASIAGLEYFLTFAIFIKRPLDRYSHGVAFGWGEGVKRGSVSRVKQYVSC